MRGGISLPIVPRASDPEVERVLRDHARIITQLIGLVTTPARIIEDVQLVDATSTSIAHGLGRRPKMIIVSPPRNTAGASGRITEDVLTATDRDRYLLLLAAGWAATITVDVMVF